MCLVAKKKDKKRLYALFHVQYVMCCVYVIIYLCDHLGWNNVLVLASKICALYPPFRKKLQRKKLERVKIQMKIPLRRSFVNSRKI